MAPSSYILVVFHLHEIALDLVKLGVHAASRVLTHRNGRTLHVGKSSGSERLNGLLHEICDTLRPAVVHTRCRYYSSIICTHSDVKHALDDTV